MFFKAIIKKNCFLFKSPTAGDEESGETMETKAKSGFARQTERYLRKFENLM
jgi:hypothetical protein